MGGSKGRVRVVKKKAKGVTKKKRRVVSIPRQRDKPWGPDDGGDVDAGE